MYYLITHVFRTATIRNTCDIRESTDLYGYMATCYDKQISIAQEKGQKSVANAPVFKHSGWRLWWTEGSKSLFPVRTCLRVKC